CALAPMAAANVITNPRIEKRTARAIVAPPLFRRRQVLRGDATMTTWGGNPVRGDAISRLEKGASDSSPRSMAHRQAVENPQNFLARSNYCAAAAGQKRVARRSDSGHHGFGFNQAKGGDPMSSEIRARGSDFGYGVVLTRQPSAK